MAGPRPPYRGEWAAGPPPGFSLETDLDEKHGETADELAKKHGSSFDRDYVKAMVDGHRDLAAQKHLDTARTLESATNRRSTN